MFHFIKHLFMILLVMFFLDFLWLHFIAGSFFAKQLESIGRFNEAGGFDVRIVPGIIVYLLMALSMEVFIFQNQSIKGLYPTLGYAAILGVIVYGVFDGTNRAILNDYPLPMVIVDVAWGTTLFTLTCWANFLVRQRLNF